MRFFSLAILSVSAAAATAEWKAGVERVRITPEDPIWMSGYASRNRPSQGVVHDLWVKALALEDSRHVRTVIVTTDLIGLPRGVAEQISAEALRRYGLERPHLLLNSSHTHTGPVVGENLATMFDLDGLQAERIRAYTQRTTAAILDAIGGALGRLEPARLGYAKGRAAFAVNRREFTPSGVKLGVNPNGPVDHDVPVLTIRDVRGALRAALFGYACHNTTLTGEFYQLSGDYAGYAQLEFERMHPGAAALFVMLSGGDQNPHPRGREEVAQQHGRTLAAAVSQAILAGEKPLRGPLRAAFQVTELEFAPHSREDFEREKETATGARYRRAVAMLAAYDERRPVRQIPYPVQAMRFGRQLTLVALGGETVVGLALRIKREFPVEETVVAGYSNDVMCYIPTAQILREGGYEAVDSMIYYGQPGPFAADVEERVIAAARRVLARVGRKR